MGIRALFNGFTFAPRRLDMKLGVGNVAFIPEMQNPLFSLVGTGIPITHPFEEYEGPQVYVDKTLVYTGLAGIPTGSFGTGDLLSSDEYAAYSGVEPG